MPYSSHLQEPWELKWKVDAASSAPVLCQQFEVSHCTGFQVLVFQLEMQGFSVSVFSLLRLTLRKESVHLWAVALRSSPLCQSKFGGTRGNVLAAFESLGGVFGSRFPLLVPCLSHRSEPARRDGGKEQGEVTQATPFSPLAFPGLRRNEIYLFIYSWRKAPREGVEDEEFRGNLVCPMVSLCLAQCFRRILNQG